MTGTARVKNSALREAQYALFCRLVSEAPGECWFDTFTHPSEVSEAKARENVEEWLRRLRQRLAPARVEAWPVFELQPLRQVWHCHVVVKAKGLDNLDKKRWSRKWFEITAKRVKKPKTTLEEVMAVFAIRRRRGLPDLRIKKPVAVPSNDFEWSYRNGGTSDIADAETPEGVIGYIMCRHDIGLLW